MNKADREELRRAQARRDVAAALRVADRHTPRTGLLSGMLAAVAAEKLTAATAQDLSDPGGPGRGGGLAA